MNWCFQLISSDYIKLTCMWYIALYCSTVTESACLIVSDLQPFLFLQAVGLVLVQVAGGKALLAMEEEEGEREGRERERGEDQQGASHTCES